MSPTPRYAISTLQRARFRYDRQRIRKARNQLFPHYDFNVTIFRSDFVMHDISPQNHFHTFNHVAPRRCYRFFLLESSHNTPPVGMTYIHASQAQEHRYKVRRLSGPSLYKAGGAGGALWRCMRTRRNSRRTTPSRNMRVMWSSAPHRTIKSTPVSTHMRQDRQSRVDRTHAHDRAVHVHVHVRRWWANHSVVDP